MHHYEHFWLDPKFWVAVSFIIFLLLVGRRIWTALTDALDARAEHAIFQQLRADPARYACVVTGRGLSADEWARYVPEFRYQRTCP